MSEKTYCLVQKGLDINVLDNTWFFGTIAQADDCFGLGIGATVEHLIAFANVEDSYCVEVVDYLTVDDYPQYEKKILNL